MDDTLDAICVAVVKVSLGVISTVITVITVIKDNMVTNMDNMLHRANLYVTDSMGILAMVKHCVMKVILLKANILKAMLLKASVLKVTGLLNIKAVHPSV